MIFPVYIRVGNLRLHPHVLFEILAFTAGFGVFLYLRRRERDHLSEDLRWWVVTAGIVGAAIGCRLLACFDTPHAAVPGKTVVGGIIGGIFAVEVAKRRLGVTTATGDLFAIPIALGIAIGRIGCFLTGLTDDTYGTVTTLALGVDFGDGIKRHPVQLYEIAFLLVLIPMLKTFWKRQRSQGDTFKLFVITYMVWRLIVDCLKPAGRIAGLSAIQIACLVMLVYYFRDFTRIASALQRQKSMAGAKNA